MAGRSTPRGINRPSPLPSSLAEASSDGMKLALSGKGGVGKTTLAALLAAALVRRGYATLAIDADPAPNLGAALGLPARRGGAGSSRSPRTRTSSRPRPRPGTRGVYNLSFPVEDVIRDRAVMTPAGAGLLVMGTVRSAGGGLHLPCGGRGPGPPPPARRGRAPGGRARPRGRARAPRTRSRPRASTSCSCSSTDRLPRVQVAGRNPGPGPRARHTPPCTHREPALRRRGRRWPRRTAQTRLGLPLLAVLPDDPAVARAGQEGRPVPTDGATAALVEALLDGILAEAA